MRRSEKEMYIRTLAVGVQNNSDLEHPELTMICRQMVAETKSRLEAIASIQIRVAEHEREISAFAVSGHYLGALLYETTFNDLGPMAELEDILAIGSTLKLRLFSMGEPDASQTKNVQGLFVLYNSSSLPELVVLAA